MSKSNPFQTPRRDPLSASAGRLPVDADFDVAFADELARLESYNKHLYRPNTYLHKWWARRCGTTFRLILKHLVTAPEAQDYYAPGGLAGRVILDPMMGGGTTLHEAIRMGANVIGVDIDPVPVLQARATLSAVPLSRLEEGYACVQARLNESIGSLFATTCPHCSHTGPLRFTLYALRRHCACGPVLLVDSLVLRYERRQPAVRLCADCHEVVAAGARCKCGEQKGAVPLRDKRTRSCPDCGQAYAEDINCPYYARYVPVAVVGVCPVDGLFFKTPHTLDRQHLLSADQRRPSLTWRRSADFAVRTGPKSRDLSSRGITSYLDLFSSRQLLYMQAAERAISDLPPLIRLYLGLLLSTSLEFNSLLCGYKGARRGDNPGAIRHTFSYHAYAFPYTALENNPLFPQAASGTLEKLFHDRIRRAREWARRPRERRLNGSSRFVHIEDELDQGTEVADPDLLQEGERRFFIHQGSATSLPLADRSVDYVVTDPPYFDSVQYSDLAVFFHVWLERMVADGVDAAWRYDVQHAAVDPHANGNGQYGRVLAQIFAECRRVLRPNGRLIFTFHHWNPKGWAALATALCKADFRLVNRYVVHSESPVSVHIAGLTSLTHDAILVLAPAEDAPAVKWERPSRIRKEDSRDFCIDCAALLGWNLGAELDAPATLRVWQKLLS